MNTILSNTSYNLSDLSSQNFAREAIPKPNV